MAMVPVLFIGGVVFGYFVVLPPATQFLQNFNSDSFNVLVQAQDYYKFAVLALAGLGILFQLPVAILAATRVGIVTPLQLRKNRRYSLLLIAVVAMLLPGTDPVTMLISMAPLLILYEASIWLAVLFNRGQPQESIIGRWQGAWGQDDEDDDDEFDDDEDWAVTDDVFVDEDEFDLEDDDDEPRAGRADDDGPPRPGVTRSVTRHALP